MKTSHLIAVGVALLALAISGGGQKKTLAVVKGLTTHSSPCSAAAVVENQNPGHLPVHRPGIERRRRAKQIVED
jgi:hypothetical protein